MNIMAPEPISTAYFIDPFHQPLCVYVYSSNIARQLHGKYFTAATNTHATIEKLLNASFLMRSVPYERKVGD
jgi:hypothetical protein